MHSVSTEDNEKVMEMERRKINNGVEIISFKEKEPKKKRNLLRSIYNNLTDILRLFEPFLIIGTVIFVLLTIGYYSTYGWPGNCESMEYMVGSIENYYRKFDDPNNTLRNYEVLDPKDNDNNTYINAYCGDDKSNGTVFSFSNGKMEVLNYKTPLKSISEFCESNNFAFLDIKFNKREGLILHGTLGYKYNNIPHIKHIKLYFPTGEIIEFDNTSYKLLRTI